MHGSSVELQVSLQIRKVRSFSGNNLLPTNERLHRIGKLQDNKCNYCNNTYTHQHIFSCPFTIQLIKPLQRILNSCENTFTSNDNLVCLDLNSPSTLRLPLAFIATEILNKAAYEHRISSKPPNLTKTRAAIKAASKIYLQTKGRGQ